MVSAGWKLQCPVSWAYACRSSALSPALATLLAYQFSGAVTAGGQFNLLAARHVEGQHEIRQPFRAVAEIV